MQIVEWDGRRITKPGCYSRIPLATYHRGDICGHPKDPDKIAPSVSSSSLRRVFCRKMGGSLRHFWAYSPLNPKKKEEADKEAWILGRAVHHLVLGEPFFNKLFVGQPDEIGGKPWSGLGSSTKLRDKWKEDQKRSGRTVLTPLQMEKILGMGEALWENPEVRKGLLNGLVERSMFWIDPETGLWVKVRPDVIPTDAFDYSDLKIIGVTPFWDEMQKAIEDWGYFMQAALVGEATQRIFGQPMGDFTNVFVQSTVPHCVDTVKIKDHHLELGHQANHQALRGIAYGLKGGHWPGPGGVGIRPIEMTARAQERIEDQLKFGEQQWASR
jgi:hypothetical protein